jgi:hypothetical protein
VKERQILGVGASDSGEGAELTDAVSGTDSAETFDAGVAIGGVRGVEFVAAADPAHLRIDADSIVDGKREVARDAKDIGDADVLETRQNVFDYCFRQKRPPRIEGLMMKSTKSYYTAGR